VNAQEQAGGANRAEELAARARELAARAERLSHDAADAAQSEETLAQLERQLADLDAEERKLDAEFAELHAEDDDRDADEPPAGPRLEDVLTGWADRLAERMETIGDRIGDAMISAFGTRGFGTFGATADRIEREVATEGALPVTIENFAGKVVVRAGGTDRVHAEAARHAWTDADRDDIQLDVTRDGRGVHVRCHVSRPDRHRWASLEVAVPPGSPTEIRTRSGSIRSEDVGGAVDAETRGGAIRVEGAVGRATLATMGGAVAVSRHEGPVRARTKGGSVKLSGHLTDEVEAETVGGSVHVEGVDGAVRAQTLGGSVHVSGRVRGDSSLSTVGGSVVLGITADSNLRVEASGTSASTDVAGLRAQRGRIEGAIGSGAEGTVRLRTSGGSVRVHLLGEA
jgi:hypothetical protein